MSMTGSMRMTQNQSAFNTEVLVSILMKPDRTLK